MPVVLLLLVTALFSSGLLAQEVNENKDTFFLAKKSGLLGTLGKSISTDPPVPDPVKVVNPFVIHSGKVIRNIVLIGLGFERNIFDTTIIKNSYSTNLANRFHIMTRDKIIYNNLFFKTGGRLHPYLLADNERHLRDQVYIQDARILIDSIPGCYDSVDVFVITKDIFPIVFSIGLKSTKKAGIKIRNENIGGSGSRLSVSTLFDKDRTPQFGYDAAFLMRNIKGSFINGSIGIETYKESFNKGQSNETYLFTHFERPLVTPYIPWVGAVDVALNKTSNNYLPDSLYNSDFKYSFRWVDVWFGYNFGSNRLLKKNTQTRLGKFISLRSFYRHFTDIPVIYHQLYDYHYADIEGVLGAITIFKQEVYRASFIYGFGRNEDVPEGFSASLIGGWTKKEEKDRSYFGIEALRSYFSKSGFYSSYTFRIGGNHYQKVWEDIDVLINADYFTRLIKMRGQWYNRNFFSVGFTKQINPVLNQPLDINSIFGLNYFRGNPGPANVRSTAKAETVFFNLRKFWGFRMAPFLFADMSMLTPANQAFKKSDLYSAIGAGVRTRNENLVFGTIELKAYYFLRTVPEMKNFKIVIGTSIKFRYKNNFILKPDFVAAN